MTVQNCNNCFGSRLRKESLSVFIGDRNISQITNYTISDLLKFIKNLKLTKKKGRDFKTNN